MRFNITAPNAPESFGVSQGYVFVDDVMSACDTSALSSDIARVTWLDKEGYIFYKNATLNTKITDPSPYQVEVNNWMTARTTAALPLTLAEAKNIKIYLVQSLFNTKRQAPFAFTIAAGAYTWDVTDPALLAMTVAAMPSFYTYVFGSLSGGTGGLTSQINAMIDQINSYIINIGNDLISYIGNTILGTNSGTATTNTVNDKLQTFTDSTSGAIMAHPGLNADIAHYGNTFNYITHIAGVSPGSAPNIAWMPIGATATVNVTLPEMMNILSGVNTRRNTLITTQNSKIAAINALTTIAAVIAYDVTAGW